MRLRFLIAAFMLLPFLLLNSTTARAAYTPAAAEAAGNRMLSLQVLKGKYRDDPLSLRDEMTRAELVTIIVRAYGQEHNAALLNGAAAYPDTAAHWASGNIAMAKALVEKAGGDAIGMPDGRFAPDAKVTPAQSVAFLMKFLGIKADASKSWPRNHLDVAVNRGLITGEDASLIGPMSNDNANRGLVFYLFDRVFAEYPLADGKTFYQKYVDTTAPVLTLNAVPETTQAADVTLSGKVEGANTIVLLQGSQSTAMAMDANGNWSVRVTLAEGENHLVVRAADLANNVDERTVTIRRFGPVVALKITPEQLTAFVGEGPFTFTAQGEDAYGNLLDIDPAKVRWTAWDETQPGTQTIRAALGDAEGTAALILRTRPTISAGNRSSTTGDIISMKITAADADGDTLTYAATGLPPGLSVDPATGTISGRVNTAGTYQVTVTVTDQDRESASASFSWRVSDPYVPAPPRPASVTAEMPLTVEVGSVSNITVIIKDQYGEAMTAPWQAGVTGEIGTVTTGDATFTAATVPGQGRVTVTVGNLAPRVLEVTVVHGPAVALHITPQAHNAFAGEGPFTFTAQGKDQYGNLFEIDAAGVAWEEWSESIPGMQTIRAALGHAEGTATLVLHTRPQLAVDNQSGTVGETASLQLAATDTDGDTLTYAASGLPAGLSLNAETGLISGQFTASGAYPVTVTAEDEDGATATATFTWTVAPGQAANQPPTVNGPATITTPPEENTVFGMESAHRMTISDPDAGDGELEVTISMTAGGFSLWTVAGLTHTSGVHDRSQSMTFRGTLTAINHALDGAIYHAAGQNDTISVTVSDLGNTGSGGAQTASHLIQVVVSAGE